MKRAADVKLAMTESIRALVAQTSSLLYRGFPIRWCREHSGASAVAEPGRMEFGDTADWKSALRQWLSCPTGRKRGRFGLNTLSFVAALLALAATSCQRHVAPATTWAVAQTTETNGVRATLRLSTVTLTTGARLDCELDVQTPAATRVELLPWQPSGLEPVDFTALPVSLTETGGEQHQFRWTFQAGPPGAVTNQSVRVNCISAPTTNALKIELPVLVIQSAFAPGTFTNALPPLEETNAF
jgi:hypothetical protein